MRLLFGVTLLCAGLSVVSACVSARVETYRCLTDFFNETNQTVPSGLERILGQATRKSSDRTRRDQARAGRDVLPDENDVAPEADTSTREYGKGAVQDGGRGRKMSSGLAPRFQEHWCGPFANYVSCMERAREKCESAGLYTCSIMTTFSALYGTYICDVDIEPWVAKDIRACKDSGAASLLLSTRIWFLHLLITWVMIK